MKEKRSLFKFIFGNKLQKNLQSFLKILSGYNPMFSETSKDIYDSNIARECIDKIATHSAKLLPKHIQEINSLNNHIKGDINYILSTQPNPIMNKFKFLYKTISMLYTSNNVFIYIDRDSAGMIKGFYPLSIQNCELLEDENNDIYIRFNFINGNSYIIPYLEIIHLVRFYNRHDIYGDSNSVLISPIETVTTSKEGIKHALKLSMSLKGIIKYTNAMLKEKDIKENRDKFIEDFVQNMDDGTGIAGLDAKSDFQEINLKPLLLTKEQLNAIDEDIYDYFGVNKGIIQSKYSDEEWNAFYESIIEPLAIQLSDEFTSKIFNQKSIKEGHKIVFTTNRLQYASLTNKIKLLKEAGSLGLLRKDEAREIIDLPAIGGEEGNKIIQSLNNIDSSIANEHQGGESNE